MFDGMHRQPGPGAEVSVAVVEFVNGPVEWLPVKQSVNAVEMEFVKQRYEEQRCQEPDGLLRDSKLCHMSVGV